MTLINKKGLINELIMKIIQSFHLKSKSNYFKLDLDSVYTVMLNNDNAYHIFKEIIILMLNKKSNLKIICIVKGLFITISGLLHMCNVKKVCYSR